MSVDQAAITAAIGQLAKSAKRRLVLVTAGKIGAGKSTVINNLLGLKGKKAAEAKLSPRSVTKNVDYYEKEIAGITVRIIDTPGCDSVDLDLTDKQEQEALLVKLLEFTDGKFPDLLLYCVSLVGGRFDGRIVEELTKAFGSEVWKHTILVLTFGDTALDNYEEDVDKNQKFRELLEAYTTEFEKALKKAGVSDVPVKPILPKSTQDDVHSLELALAKPEITGIPVGRNTTRPPGWAPLLFKEILKRCRIDAIPALLVLTGITPDSVNEVLKAEAKSTTEAPAKSTTEAPAKSTTEAPAKSTTYISYLAGLLSGAVGGVVLGGVTGGAGSAVGYAIGMKAGAAVGGVVGAGAGLVANETIGRPGIYAGMTAKRKFKEWTELTKIAIARLMSPGKEKTD